MSPTQHLNSLILLDISEYFDIIGLSRFDIIGLSNCLDASHLLTCPKASSCSIPLHCRNLVNFYLHLLTINWLGSLLNYRPDLKFNEYPGKNHVGYKGYPEKEKIKQCNSKAPFR